MSQKGEIYISALVDTIIPEDVAIFLIKGRFWPGNKAAELIQAGALHYKFTNESLVVSDDSSKGNPALANMARTPIQINTYLSELGKSGFVLVKLHNHKVSRKSGSANEFEVEAANDTALEQQLPKNNKTRPTVANISQWINVPSVLKSDRVRVIHRVSLNASTNTVETGYPGLHTKVNIEVKANELVCLSLNTEV